MVFTKLLAGQAYSALPGGNPRESRKSTSIAPSAVGGMSKMYVGEQNGNTHY